MSFDKLPEEERLRVAAQVDYFVGAVLHRYGMDESDIPALVDALRHFREHKELMGRIKAGGMLSLIALTATATASALWQGVKTILTGGPK